MNVDVVSDDCYDALRALPKESVHCVVTSPPYWGLRDYGTGGWSGGDAACDHTHGNDQSFAYTEKRDQAMKTPMLNVCRRCGATRVDRQLGLERSPADYVERLVVIFREVRRVLRKDGTLWLNLGDVYAQSGRGADTNSGLLGSRKNQEQSRVAMARRPAWLNGVRRKELIGLPWRVAFALQDDGWRLRSPIVWAKPNPTPESVRDRPTRSYEMVFLFAKSRHYFYDAAAISEPAVEKRSRNKKRKPSGERNEPGGARARQSSSVPWEGTRRNKRDVWRITTKPYKGKHFAVMPRELARLCIMAGCPPGGKVLDPFAGMCTSGVEAVALGCDFYGIELNADYAAEGRERIRAEHPGLALGRRAS